MLPFDGGDEDVSLLSRRRMTPVRLTALISSGTPNSTPAQRQALALGSSQVHGSLRVKQIDKKGTREMRTYSLSFSADIWSRSHLSQLLSRHLVTFSSLSAYQPCAPVSRSIRSLRHSPTEIEPSRLLPGHTSFIWAIQPCEAFIWAIQPCEAFIVHRLSFTCSEPELSAERCNRHRSCCSQVSLCIV